MATPESPSLNASIPHQPLQSQNPPPTQSDDTPLLSRPGPRLTLAGVLFATFSAFSTRRALVRRKAPIVLSPAAAKAQFAQAARHAQRQAASGPVSSSPAHTNGGSLAGQTGSIRPSGGVQGQAAGQTTSSTVGGGSAILASEGTAAVSATSEAISAAEAGAPELHNSGAILAFEALSLATINVFSWAMIGVGSVLWMTDIRGMDDLRRRVRGGLGIDGSGRTEEQVEEEMEEWLVGVLARKEDKERARARGVDLVVRDEKGRVRSVGDD